MPQEEKIGYHKGALEALLNERSELSRLLKIVNSLVEKHGKQLEQAGVDVEQFVNNLQDRQAEKMKNMQKSLQKDQGQNQGQPRRTGSNRQKRSGRSKQKKNYDLSGEELPE
ncbi:MAG: hypothetical protein ACLFS3_02500 [Candidatus Aenigmatarchaeota archaeon]